ncbi:hypothetical protein D7D52_22060 [Nocardia yunnanensis]|uniref:Uncharacterized protein n=1 Tax=Nocardia yunnanensis TaxID=2382165 RepID=A0A386ZEX6_9NOCA|nr:hypothetical protein [Nocardia yunnanensis]AYF76076.1 hypothetical protein D7D52_22060 [Nocardia yunnanensis]
MNQQALATLLAAVLSAAAAVSAPWLSYRISARDRRENLTRDLELYSKIADGDFASREGLKDDIDRRITQLHSMHRYWRLVRLCAVSGGILVFCLVFIIGTDTYTARRSMRQFLVSVGGWTAAIVMIVALVAFIAALAALLAEMIVAGRPAGFAAAMVVLPFLMVIFAVVWLILGIITQVGNRQRRRTGTTPKTVADFVPFMRETWRQFAPWAVVQ